MSLHPGLFKDLHAGEPCLVLGNGPSLDQVDFSKVKMHTIGIHRSWKKVVSPYHVILRQNRWWDEIEQSKWIPNVVWARGEPGWFNAKRDSYVVRVKGRTPVICLSSAGFGRFSFDLYQDGTWQHNAGLLAMEVAAYMGFDPIYLSGFDIEGGHFGNGNEDAAKESVKRLQYYLFKAAAQYIKRERPRLVIKNVNPNSRIAHLFDMAEFRELYGQEASSDPWERPEFRSARA